MTIHEFITKYGIKDRETEVYSDILKLIPCNTYEHALSEVVAMIPEAKLVNRTNPRGDGEIVVANVHDEDNAFIINYSPAYGKQEADYLYMLRMLVQAGITKK